ncbi:MAG: homoserine dehydrogenase [Alicyclobacillus shizuokensis]|nr:homoserine dehydrogenase [Alicyclobacillus shizuokensis]
MAYFDTIQPLPELWFAYSPVDLVILNTSNREQVLALLDDKDERIQRKLQALAEANGLARWSTDLEACLADPYNEIYFDSQTTALREVSVKKAIAAGKHIVTANKDLIASHGPEIWEAAAKAGVDVYYEAAVGGAIPLIRPLKESLTANDITDLKGILNGTTNYILTRMTETRAEFADALREAQDLGYAEADPSSDVDGLDAARKLAILASIAFHTQVRLEDVEVAGIRSVSARDVQYAQELGAVIKLLATATDRGGQLALRVRPTLVPRDHPLASVSDSYNALFVRGDASGDLMFFGRGAGSLPTASAVVGDLIEVLRNLRLGVVQMAPQVCLLHKRVDAASMEPARHYLRLLVDDQPGVFAQIAGLFGEGGVSMESVLQKRVHNSCAEIVIVTHRTSPRRLREVLSALRQLASVREICSVMPVEPGDKEGESAADQETAGAAMLPLAVDG